jgi:hypothetical protein
MARLVSTTPTGAITADVSALSATSTTSVLVRPPRLYKAAYGFPYEGRLINPKSSSQGGVTANQGFARSCPEAASSEFAAGDFVNVIANVVTALPASLTASTLPIAGIALDAGSNGAATTYYPEVLCVDSASEWIMNFCNTTTPGTTTNRADVILGATYEIMNATVTYTAHPIYGTVTVTCGVVCGAVTPTNGVSPMGRVKVIGLAPDPDIDTRGLISSTYASLVPVIVKFVPTVGSSATLDASNVIYTHMLQFD